MRKNLKKLLLILIFSLCLLTLASCTPDNAVPTPGEPMVVELPEIPQGTIQQEETTELHIWMEGDISGWVREFNEVYPEIRVTVESPYAVLGGTYPHLPKTLADGSGEYEYPDVVYVSNYLYVYQWEEKREEAFADIYKMMDSGALLDMTEFMENDPEFDLSQFDQKTLECGKYRGGQYLLPKAVGSIYRTLLGRSDKLEQAGFQMESLKNANEFLSELTRVRKETGMKSTLTHMGYCSKEDLLFQACAPDLVDFDSGEILPEEEKFEEFCRTWKEFFYGEQRERENINDVRSEDRNAPKLLDSAQALFEMCGDIDILSCIDLKETLPEGASLIKKGMPDVNGEVIGEGIENFGICTYGENHHNAWKFIKFILSYPELESGALPTFTEYQSPAVESIVEKRRQKDNYNLSQEEEEAFKAEANNFDRYRFSSTKLFEIFTETMEPFFRDEADYGTCIVELKNGLKDYLLD